jgi:hypothetical protein
MLKKAMTSDAVMLVRNIDKAPYHLGSDAEPESRYLLTAISVIGMDIYVVGCTQEIGRGAAVGSFCQKLKFGCTSFFINSGHYSGAGQLATSEPSGIMGYG